jgi:CpXC motif protein
MATNPPRLVNVACPACQTHYSTPVQSVVDVGSDPRLKTLLLQGRINVGVCPSCGAAGMLSIPLTYHDPEKELLLCVVPQELQLDESSRQRMIGEMSNAIINGLPAERRKGYLIQPRLYLSFQTLVEAILEADGVTKEMLQAQQERLVLINQMLEVVDDSIRLSALIGEGREKIDYELFSLLTHQMNGAEHGGRSETLGKLTRLRDALLERTDTGREIAEQQKALEDALSGIDENLTREELLERVLAAEGEHEDEILNVLVSMVRPLIDYQFFQMLTSRIDEAMQQNDASLAERLKALRDKILDTAQELDAQVRIQTQDRARLLSEIMESEQPKDTIRAHSVDIDDIFMSVLDASIAQNQEEHPQVAQRLLAIRNQIVEVMQESAPPELRFISQLMGADYPDETRKILTNNQAMVTPQLVEMMETLVGEFVNRKDMDASEKMKGILAQAKLMS